MKLSKRKRKLIARAARAYSWLIDKYAAPGSGLIASDGAVIVCELLTADSEELKELVEKMKG